MDKNHTTLSLPAIAIPISPQFDDLGQFILRPDTKFLCCQSADDNHLVFALFTDENAAQAYALSQKVPYEPVFLDVYEPVLELLRFGKDTLGCVAVAINPPVLAERVPAIPIGDAIATIEGVLGSVN